MMYHACSGNKTPTDTLLVLTLVAEKIEDTEMLLATLSVRGCMRVLVYP